MASVPKACTWSAGCMATRTTFSASESSLSAAPLSMTRQGTGWSVSSQRTLAGEVAERVEPAAAGDDGVVLAAVLAGSDRACHEVLEQPVGGDGGLELGEGGLAGLGPADVSGRALQPVERDGSDDGIVHVVQRIVTLRGESTLMLQNIAGAVRRAAAARRARSARP